MLTDTKCKEESRESHPISKDDQEKIKWADISIASNGFLMVLKLVVGILIFSISVISEGLHTGIDVMASVIASYSIMKSIQPADKDHAFGHGKYENISGTIQALLIFFVSILIIYEAGTRLYTWILHGVQPIVADWGILVMLISLIVNIVVGWKLAKIAKKHDSISIEANAYHFWADVYTSLAVFVGLIVIKIGQLMKMPNISYLDPVIAIVIAILILKTAWDITKKSMHGLLDGSLPEHEEKIIKDTIEEHYHKYVEYHNFRSRKSGSERHIDLHLVVAKNISVQKAHDICDHLEQDIQMKLPKTKVVIHTEPCDGECNYCKMERSYDGKCESLKSSEDGDK